MQTNTDFNVPDFFAQHEKPLFWLGGLFAVVFFLTGIYCERSFYFIIPFGLFFLTLVLLNFRVVFFIMLLVLPFSVESYIGSFGTDLPSEPIVMLLAGCTLLYLLFNQQELQHKSFKHPVFIILLLMLVWSIFATLFSTDIVLSIKYVLAKSWYLLGFFYFTHFIIAKQKINSIIFLVFIYSNLFKCIICNGSSRNDEIYL